MEHSPGFLAYVDARRSQVTERSVAEARAELQARPEARLIDVREDREWHAAHAAGAEHIARGVLERDIERRVPDPATPLYLYCGGGYRSALAAATLQEMGYTHVVSIAGGWRAWEEAGAPIERGDATAAGASS
jgi:rhodanese-related sulfurtransferase